jgi:hypothetical protein
MNGVRVLDGVGHSQRRESARAGKVFSSASASARSKAKRIALARSFRRAFHRGDGGSARIIWRLA